MPDPRPDPRGTRGCRRGVLLFAPIGPPALLTHPNIFLSTVDFIEGGSLTAQWTVNWSTASSQFEMRLNIEH